MLAQTWLLGWIDGLICQGGLNGCPQVISLQGTRLRTDNPGGQHKGVVLSKMVGFIAVPSFLDACEACFSTSLT